MPSAHTEYRLTQSHMDAGLKALAKRDPDIRAALKVSGFPKARKNSAGYRTMMHIIVAQQLSGKAARTIIGRMEAMTKPRLTAERFLRLSDADLKTVGLSGQKMRYGRALSEAVKSRSFQPGKLKSMDDAAAIEAITALLGFGRWSAEMYLMFSLGRPDIWPAGDLGVQEGVKRLKGLKERPLEKEMDALANDWAPHRSAAAIFMWHILEDDVTAV